MDTIIGERVGVKLSGRLIRSLFILCKPGITAMNLLMLAGGYWLALESALRGGGGSGNFYFWHFFAVLLGGGAVISGSCMLNMYLERERDRGMVRTASRPLPKGEVPPGLALGVGLFLLLAGGLSFFLSGSLLSGVLALAAAFIYVLVYTPLKVKTGWHIPVGAISGAMPPLLGWSAVTDTIDWGGLSLFLFLFYWQLPHTISLILLYREDYLRGGVAVDWVAGERIRGEKLLLWSLSFLPLSVFLLWSGGIAGWTSSLIIAAFGIFVALSAAISFRRGTLERDIRKVFMFTVFFLPVSIASLLLEHLVLR